MKHSASLLTTFLLGAIIFGAASFVLAWIGPTGTAPNNNVSAPINVGAMYQEKQGILGALGILNTGSLTLLGSNRYLAFDSTANAAGYGIRDNAGFIELKNLGGAWGSLFAANGGVNIPTSASVTSCSAAVKGSLRYNSTSNQMEYCNGSSWVSLGSSSGIASCRVCSQFRYEWYGYKWSSQGCSSYSSGNTLQTAQSGTGYGYVVQVNTSIQCQ